jgi:hypothetical protein
MNMDVSNLASTNNVTGGANNEFSPTILRESVGTQESQPNVVGEKGARGGVVELAVVVALEGMHQRRNRMEIGEEVLESGKGVGLEPQRKSVEKIRETIQIR